MIDLEEILLNKLEKSWKRKKWHIAVSLTNHCPLQCRHCIVDALHASYDRSIKTLELSEWLENGLEENKDIISFLSFTGGESSLADLAFDRVGRKAKLLNIPCGLITSGYFAKSVDDASKFFHKYDFIKKITISMDEYHAEFLPISFCLNALHAAKKLNIYISIRYTGSVDSEFYKNLINTVTPLFGDIIEKQKIVRSGRAIDFDEIAEFDESNILSQCLSDGPHINYNGDILPCCSNIISNKDNKLLSFGNIINTSLNQALSLMNHHRLLKIIRVYGWDHIVDNIKIIENDKKIKGCGACQQCELINNDKIYSAVVDYWVNKTNNGEKSFLKANSHLMESNS